jgi:hypothetical protein
MDQVYYYDQILQDISTDDRCNYAKLDPAGPEYAAINREFNRIIGKD